ncbi:MAG: YlxR family protein [Lachnospiraceae bacterium]|nr:YlxR family protein [Lachnospiraceae bacterium]
MGCRTARNKSELIRVVRTPEGEVAVDRTGKMNGRGAYLCADAACLKKAAKSGALGRALRVSIPEDVILELGREIAEENSV